jgi:hypothetical protein
LHGKPASPESLAEAYACALVLSGRRAKKPIHDGSQKNELNGYDYSFVNFNEQEIIV